MLICKYHIKQNPFCKDTQNQQSNNGHQRRYNNNNTHRGNSFQASNRIIGDPFAPSTVTNNENIDTMNTINNNKPMSMSSKPAWKSTNDSNPIMNKRQNTNTMHHGGSQHGSQYNDPYDRDTNSFSNNHHHQSNNNRGGFGNSNDYNPRNQAPPNNNPPQHAYGQNTPFGKSNPHTFDDPIAPQQQPQSDNNNYDNYGSNNNKWQTPANKAPNNANYNRPNHQNTNYRNNNVRNQNRNPSQYAPSNVDREDNVKPAHSVDYNQFATTSDFKKVVSMIEQLRGQMHALQFQIDNVKAENNKLKQRIQEMEKEQNEIKKMKHLQPAPTTMTNHHISSTNPTMNTMNARSKNVNFSSSKQSSMDIDQANNQQKYAQNDRFHDERYDQQRFGQQQNNNLSHFSQENLNKFDHQQNMNQNQNQQQNVQQQSRFDDNRYSNFNNNHQQNNVGAFNEKSIELNNGMYSQRHSANDRFSNNNQAQNNQFGDNNGNDDEEEIAAPPKSSAADLIAKLEKTQGAYEQTGQLIPCNQCGRKFSHKALQRHIKICKKVFGQKRKAFNNKVVDDEAIKAKRNTNTAQVEAELRRKKEQAKAKWKAQSSMLRDAIKSSKLIEKAMKEGKSLKDIPNMPSTAPDTRVPCPHCGRKFAEETARRHIPKCQNIKSRPKALKRRR